MCGWYQINIAYCLFSFNDTYAMIYSSSPKPSCSQGELVVCIGIIWRLSIVRRPPFSGIFSSEITLSIEAKFYVEPPWERRTTVFFIDCSHDEDGRHKKPLKSSEPEV